MANSYIGKTFTIDNGDARIRLGDDLMTFAIYRNDEPRPPGKKVGDVKIIPKGTRIRVSDAKALARKLTYVHAESAKDEPVAVYGWTSAANLVGRFVNETLRSLPPVNNDQKGPNAAWEHGVFIGQKTLVEIVGNNNETERIVEATLTPYLALVGAAQNDGVTIALRSGFRTYAEQQQLYDEFLHNKHPTAAPPGASNHQHGQAFDLDVGGYDGDPVYDWLKKNGPPRGFVRTVNKEPWHWEYRPNDAAALLAAGKFKMPNVAV